jgi:hypothetical protein
MSWCSKLKLEVNIGFAKYIYIYIYRLLAIELLLKVCI